MGFKLKCDICHKNKKMVKKNKNGFSEFNMYHFSGMINGKMNNHIHLCRKCTKAGGYDNLFIYVPSPRQPFTIKGE